MLAVLTGASALFLAALDFSINVSLPVFRDSLGETIVSVQWIIIIYHAARSGAGFIAGSIADMFGLKRILLAGIILYTVSVAIISAQGALTPIAGLRVPQGIGVAILFTVGPAIVARAFGPSRRGSALGVTLAAVGAGQVVGTLGGGWLSLNLGWPAIFWARVPVGAAILLIAVKANIDRPPRGSDRAPSEGRRAFDWPGAALIFTLLFTLVLGLSFSRLDGWTAPRPLLFHVLTVLLAAIFALRQRVAINPVFPAALLKSGAFIQGNLSNLTVTLGTFVMWFMFPFYVADVMDRSTLVLGTLLASMALATLIGSAAAGWVADRAGDRVTTFTGALISGGGLWMVGMQGAEAGAVTVGLAAGLMGLGFGIHQAAVYALTLRGAEQRHVGAASATLAVAQTLGTVLSISVMTSLLAWRESGGASFLEGYRDVYLVAAAVTALGGLLVIKPLIATRSGK